MSDIVPRGGGLVNATNQAVFALAPEVVDAGGVCKSSSLVRADRGCPALRRSSSGEQVVTGSPPLCLGHQSRRGARARAMT